MGVIQEGARMTLQRRIVGLIVCALLGAPLAASAATPKNVTFNSPLENILCAGTWDIGYQTTKTVTYVECMVLNQAWNRLPPRPKEPCDVGHWLPYQIWLGVSRNARRLVPGGCRSDVGPFCFESATQHCRELAYGSHVDVGAIRCSSARNGITCRYVDGRRVGFRIAYEGYALWHG
jgi:hypothetical protein